MKEQEYEITWYKTDMYSLVIIAKGREGTHKNYDVIFNSDCNGEYFKDKLSGYKKIVEVLSDDEEKYKRYPMCKDQPAQIDCRRDTCIHHKNGSCNNVSPAITINENGSFFCWSEVTKS